MNVAVRSVSGMVDDVTLKCVSGGEGFGGFYGEEDKRFIDLFLNAFFIRATNQAMSAGKDEQKGTTHESFFSCEEQLSGQSDCLLNLRMGWPGVVQQLLILILMTLR